MPLFSRIADYTSLSIVRKFRLINIMVLTLVFIIFAIIMGISSSNFSHKISELYTSYYVTKVHNLVETDLNQEIFYMNTLASSERLIEWFQDSENKDLARDVVNENKVVFSNLIEKNLILNIVKDEKSFQVSGFSLDYDDLNIKQLPYSKEQMNEDYAIISSKPETFYLRMSSNALTGSNSVWFTTAVYDNEEFLGTLSFEVDFVKITNKISDLDTDIVRVYIADEEGYLKTSSIIGFDYLWNFDSINILDRLGSSNFTEYYHELSTTKNSYILEDNLKVFETEYVYLDETKKSEVLVSALSIENTPWNIICITDIDRFSSYWNNSQVFLYIFIAFIVFYCLILYITEVTFKRPIYEFLDSLRSFKEDKSTVLYGLNQKDEIGYIANMFYEMSSKLVESNLELEHVISKRTYELKMKTYDLEHSEKRIEKFLDVTVFAILTFTGDGEFLSCNKKAIEIFAVKDKNEVIEIINRSPSSILGDLDIKKAFIDSKKESFEPIRTILKTSFGKVFLADVFCHYTPSAKNTSFDIFDLTILCVDEEEEEDDIFKPKTRVYNPDQEIIVINPSKGIDERNKEE